MKIQAGSIMTPEEGSQTWEVLDFNGDRDVWHGAPVISSSSGKLIGVMLIESRTAKIMTVAGMGL